MFTSSSLNDILGINPDDFDPGLQFTITHPDDQKRHGVSRAKMFKLSNELYTKTGDNMFVSTSLRFQHKQGHYINFIVQAYAFYSTIPKPSVYCLFVSTDIDWFGPIKHGFHFCVDKNGSCFRVPDETLIKTGCIFTDREYEILNLIRQGLDSQKIGDKLFLSKHTVDTHRRNLLNKTQHQSTSDLIIDLQERGFF